MTDLTEIERHDNSPDGRITRLEYSVKDIDAKVDSNFKTVFETLNKVVNTVDALRDGRKPNYGVIAAFAAVVLGILSSLGGISAWILNSNISSRTDPIASNVQHLSDALQQVEGLNSKIWDRLTTNERSSADNLSQSKTERAHLEEKYCEIETQFRAEDKIRNIQVAEAQRQSAMAYEQMHPGMRYPPISYFPEMAQDTNCVEYDR